MYEGRWISTRKRGALAGEAGDAHAGGGVLRARPTTSLGGGGEGGGGGGGGGGKGGEGNESNHSGASVGGSAVTTPASTPFPLRKSDDETGTQLGMPQPVPPPGSFKRAGKPMGPEPASEPAAAPPLVTTSVVLSPDAISATSETEEKLSEDGERKLLCCDARNWCRYLCGPVMHPDGRFRSGWNIMLAVFILYCGVSVPLEIAFDEDMSLAMCGRGTMREDAKLPHVVLVQRDRRHMVHDGHRHHPHRFIREGHFVDDDWLAARAYLRSSFTIDTLGTFPINLILMPPRPTIHTATSSSPTTTRRAARQHRTPQPHHQACTDGQTAQALPHGQARPLHEQL